MTSMIASSAEPNLETNATKLQRELDRVRQELEDVNMKLQEQKNQHDEDTLRLMQSIAAIESEKAALESHSRRRDEELLRLMTAGKPARYDGHQQEGAEETDGIRQALTETKSQQDQKVEMAEHNVHAIVEVELQSLQRENEEYRSKISHLEAALGDNERELLHKEMELARVQCSVKALQSELQQYKHISNEIELNLREIGGIPSTTKSDSTDGQNEATDTEVFVSVQTVSFPLSPAPPLEPGDSKNIPEEATSYKVSLEELEQSHAESLEANRALEIKMEALQTKLLASQDEYEQHVSNLQNRMLSVEKELADRSKLHEDEINQLKEESLCAARKREESAETRLAEVRDEFQKQMQSARQLSDLQLESARQELKACEHNMKALQAKVDDTESQYETALLQLSGFRKQEHSYRQQIAELRTTEERCKCEIDQLRIDLQHQKEELEAVRESERKCKQYIAHLTEEFEGLKQTPGLSTPRSPTSPSHRRLSQHSDQSVHEEVISQMKTQLEDLQKILISQSKGGVEAGDEELSLIQELLFNNSRLQSELRREREDRELYGSDAQSFDFTSLKVRSPEHGDRKVVQSVASSLVKNLSSLIDSLQTRCNTSFNGYSHRITELATLIAALAQCLHEKNSHHPTVGIQIGGLGNENDVNMFEKELTTSSVVAEHSQITTDTEARVHVDAQGQLESGNSKRENEDDGGTRENLAEGPNFPEVDSKTVTHSTTTEVNTQGEVEALERSLLQKVELLKRREMEVAQLRRALDLSATREAELVEDNRRMTDQLQLAECVSTPKKAEDSATPVRECVEAIMQCAEAVQLEVIYEPALEMEGATVTTASEVTVSTVEAVTQVCNQQFPQ